MSTEIYYFSGTGNSLHVAKELQQRITETYLTLVVSLLDKDVIETDAETVGFVFPVHMMTIPFPVKRFLKKLDLQSAKYIFTVSTKGGTISLEDIHIEEILQEKGKCLDAYFYLKMPYNSPVGLMPINISTYRGHIGRYKRKRCISWNLLFRVGLSRFKKLS